MCVVFTLSGSGVVIPAYKLNKVMYDILYNLHCKDIQSPGWTKCINSIFQNNGMSYIWATQDCKVDSNKVHKCECDQFIYNLAQQNYM